MIGNKFEDYVKSENFYNCYIGDTDNVNFSNNIFCMYESDNSSATQNDYYLTQYDINENARMYVYTIPSKYQRDYDTFVESRYSKFSEEYKDRVLEFFNIDRIKGRYEVDKKPDKPTVRQVLFPKNSDRDKYIWEKTGCDWQPDWEILDRIDEREVFDKTEYEHNKAKLLTVP